MEFMVSAQFRAEDQAAIVALIPKEQARVKTLREQGIEEAIYISSDFSHVWLVMQSESREQLQAVLETLPLYPYMQLEVIPLSRM